MGLPEGVSKGIVRPTTKTAPKKPPPKTPPPARKHQVAIDLPADVWLNLWGIKREDEHTPADVIRRLIYANQALCPHREFVADAGGKRRCKECAWSPPTSSHTQESTASGEGQGG